MCFGGFSPIFSLQISQLHIPIIEDDQERKFLLDRQPKLDILVYINMKHRKEGKNKTWFIYKTSNEVEDELLLETKVFNKEELQQKFDEIASQLVDGEEVEFGTSCDKWCYAPILTVVHRNGGLKREVAKGNRVLYYSYSAQPK